MSDMRSESDILKERLENDMVAQGDFTAIDLMGNSVNPDDFIKLDNAPTAGIKRPTPEALQSALEKQDEEDSRTGFKLHLYNKDKT